MSRTPRDRETTRSLLLLDAEMTCGKALAAWPERFPEVVVVVRWAPWRAEPFYYAYPAFLIWMVLKLSEERFNDREDLIRLAVFKFHRFGKPINEQLLLSELSHFPTLKDILDLHESTGSPVDDVEGKSEEPWTVLTEKGAPAAVVRESGEGAQALKTDEELVYGWVPPFIPAAGGIGFSFESTIEEDLTLEPLEGDTRSGWAMAEPPGGEMSEPPFRDDSPKPAAPSTEPTTAPPPPPLSPMEGHIDGVIDAEFREEAEPSVGTPIVNLPTAAPPPPPLPPNRYLNASAPPKIELQERFGLMVWVGLEKLAHGLGAGATGFDGADFGPVPIAGTITLEMRAPGFTCKESSLELEVPESGPSRKVRFSLTAIKKGLQTIEIDAFKGSAYLGALQLQVGVGVDAEAGSGTGMGDMDMRDPETGEFTLEVDYDADERQYTFRLRGPDVTYDPVQGKPLTGDLLKIYNGILRDLNAEARKLHNRTPEQLEEWLKDFGAQVFAEFIPDEVKKVLREDKSKIGRLTILSRNDFMPWELLYVTDENSLDGSFLVDTSMVCRWCFGRHAPKTVGSQIRHFVIPGSAPDASNSELDSVKNIMGDGQIISEIDGLRNVLFAGGFGLMHFMAHNVQPEDETERPYIPFPKRNRFDLTALTRIPSAMYANESPLVFMNACTTAGQIPLYTEIGGWAKKFVQCGTGAFVGTLWEVRDESAATFSAAFYKALHSGSTLGEAMVKGRAVLDKGDPSRLAYTLYGNPLARFGRG